MKLFQIEEPDGAPLESDGPGAAVGIDVGAGNTGRVAVALGGNAEILPDADGNTSFTLVRERTSSATKAVTALLLELRSRAEKQLARPVTHAVIAADEKSDRAAIEEAATAAGLVILRLMTHVEAASLAKGAKPENAAVLGAAIAAEDLAPLDGGVRSA